MLQHAARLGRRREIGEPEARREEHRREDGGGARQEVRRARGAEQAPRPAAAEGRAHVGALAVLQEHQHDDADRGEDVEHEDQRLHFQSAFQWAPAACQIATNSSLTSDAPPTRPPSTFGIANNSAAFAAFTLPPYRIGSCAAMLGSSLAAMRPRMKTCASSAWALVAVFPVPMAHTGS